MFMLLAATFIFVSFLSSITNILAKATIAKYSPKVVLKVIHTLFRNRKSWFKISAKALKNKCEPFYTLLIWEDNTDYLEYISMFKQIVPASLNIPSLKAADKN